MATFTVGPGGDFANWAAITFSANNIYDGQGLTFAEDITVTSVNNVTIRNTTLSGEYQMLAVTSDDFTLQDFAAGNNSSDTAIRIIQCDRFTGIRVSATDSDAGVTLQECNDGVCDLIVTGNSRVGVRVFGDTANLDITGTFSNNGNSDSGDRDGIGVGQDGGTVTGLVIHDAIFQENGPIGTSVQSGAGLYLGTGNPFSCEMSVLRCQFIDNYRMGLHIGNEWVGGDIVGNVCTGTTGDQGWGAFHINPTGMTQTGNICNNTITQNTGNTSGLRLFGAAGGGNTLNVQNNIFDRNDGSSFTAELNMSVVDANRTADYNRYNVEGSNDAAVEASNTYATAELWAAANGGANEATADPQLNNVYRPQASAIWDAGGKWWTGSRPIGGDGGAFPDWDISVGAYQSRDVPLHPARTGGEAESVSGGLTNPIIG